MKKVYDAFVWVLVRVKSFVREDLGFKKKQNIKIYLDCILSFIIIARMRSFIRLMKECQQIL